MNDISSPPYPSMDVLSPTLYRYMVEFREWWGEHCIQLIELTDPDAFDHEDPDALASESYWENVSVMGKARALLYLRRMREGWDAILRDHEDAWDSDTSIQRQIGLLHMGRNFLNVVFLTPEEYEAMEVRAGRSESDMRAFDDVSSVLPDDFSIIDIVGEDFDPDVETEECDDEAE